MKNNKYENVIEAAKVYIKGRTSVLVGGTTIATGMITNSKFLLALGSVITAFGAYKSYESKKWADDNYCSFLFNSDFIMTQAQREVDDEMKEFFNFKRFIER